MQAPKLGDALGARADEQVKRVAEDQLETERLDVGEAQRPHRTLRRQRDERGRLDNARGRDEPPGPGGSITCLYFESETAGVVAHTPSLGAATPRLSRDERRCHSSSRSESRR